MPKLQNLNKVLVIGPGPIIIGQGAEFDYSATQCLNVLKEQGIESIIVNSNPATIMTDKSIADHVYMEPLTKDFLKKIILKERPDGIIGTFGGQTALNLLKELWDDKILQEEGVRVLGTNIAAIEEAEDRMLFKQCMQKIKQPVPTSRIIHTVDEAINVAEEIGYPVVVRPAYTLGGSGGGIVHNIEEMQKIVTIGLQLSSVTQCLIEKSIAGLKEIEFEVLVDNINNAITICGLENIDPVGVHTGDSIVVAPILTLTDYEVQMLRSASLTIVKSLGIKGACNVQLAIDPYSKQYYVIEVNPRVSRSSALASKATGYPIAKIAAYVALGFNLDEIINPITGTTYAAFEPSLDYVVCKFPRFPFDKFKEASNELGTQMKATGETMSIGRSFEEAFLKGVRSLELDFFHVINFAYTQLTQEELFEQLHHKTEQRPFIIAESLRKGISVESINQITKIDLFFLDKFKKIIDLEFDLQSKKLDKEFLLNLKQNGFTNEAISYFSKEKIETIAELLNKFKITTAFHYVDTCAAEFEAKTPYFYSTFGEVNESIPTSKKKVVIIGSGPIRIGQGIEFDYSCVHSVFKAREMGFETIMINNNPGTVSTDFSISDRLYFEPLFDEDVVNILKHERPEGVILQFGGQTAISLAETIHKNGFKILGSSLEIINLCEDRKKFEKFLDERGIKRPKGVNITSIEEMHTITDNLKFPLMLRPSFVLGGRDMEIVHDQEGLTSYLTNIFKQTLNGPILIDEYISGKEVEVDALSDGTNVFIPGVMEHIERAGVHSGDSMSVYPTKNLFEEMEQKVIALTQKLTRDLQVVGLINLQFIVKKGEVYIIEVNPRASRTLPFISKMTNLNLAQMATELILGKTLKEIGVTVDVYPKPNFYSVKAPIFSFEKIKNVETALGPEMKSTGEIIGRDETFALALYKSLIASNFKVATSGRLLVTVSDRYKDEIIPLIQDFFDHGFKIYATENTKNFIQEHTRIPVQLVDRIGESDNDIKNLIESKKVDLIINTISKGKKSNTDGKIMRRLASEKRIPCFTSLDTAHAYVEVLNHISPKVFYESV